MFFSDIKESYSSFLDAHTLNRMLTFLSTGTVEQHLQWEEASKLYYAADKYQVSSLKKLCTPILRVNTAISNVSDVIALVDRHQEQTSFLHDPILSHIHEILVSDAWEEFVDSNFHLAECTTRTRKCYKSRKANKLMQYTDDKSSVGHSKYVCRSVNPPGGLSSCRNLPSSEGPSMIQNCSRLSPDLVRDNFIPLEYRGSLVWTRNLVIS